jgi:hypothetical protein
VFFNGNIYGVLFNSWAAESRTVQSAVHNASILLWLPQCPEVLLLLWGEASCAPRDEYSSLPVRQYTGTLSPVAFVVHVRSTDNSNWDSACRERQTEEGRANTVLSKTYCAHQGILEDLWRDNWSSDAGTSLPDEELFWKQNYESSLYILSLSFAYRSLNSNIIIKDRCLPTNIKKRLFKTISLHMNHAVIVCANTSDCRLLWLWCNFLFPMSIWIFNREVNYSSTKSCTGEGLLFG